MYTCKTITTVKIKQNIHQSQEVLWAPMKSLSPFQLSFSLPYIYGITDLPSFKIGYLHFLEFHINGIEYIHIFVWLILLSIIIFWYIHVVTCISLVLSIFISDVLKFCYQCIMVRIIISSKCIDPIIIMKYCFFPMVIVFALKYYMSDINIANSAFLWCFHIVFFSNCLLFPMSFFF